MTALEVVRKFHPDVKQVVDAKTKLTIEVTKEDSKSRAVRNHKECAFAVACKRMLDADGVIIALRRAYIVKGGTAKRYDLPETVSREVVSFDRHAGFSTGVYSLVPPGNKLGAKPKGKRHGSQDNRDGRDPAQYKHHLTKNVHRIEGCASAGN